MKLLDIISEIATDLSNVYPFEYYPPANSFSSTEYYNFETENQSYVVRFYPSQPKKYYPEGSYGRDYMTRDMMAMSGIEPISDKSMTGENKALKVNATVMAITMDWFEKHPDFTQLVIEPVDERRLRIVKQFVDNAVGGKYDVTIDSMPGLYGKSVIIRNPNH